MALDYHEDTALLIERMCQYVEREDFRLQKAKAADRILRTYDLFNLPRPKKVVWLKDIFGKYNDIAGAAGAAGSARSARSARSAWAAWSARSARSAGAAWTARSAGAAWTARSAGSAWSAWSARSAGAAGSARSALDDEFYWFVFEYEYCKNPDSGRLPNENDQKYLDYSELLLQALEYGAGYRTEWEDTLYIVPLPLVKIDDRNRFHSDANPAIRWKGGKELYYLQGVNFEKPLWEKITSQKITAKEVMQIRDSDQRTIAISMLRPDRLLKQLNAKLIDTGKKGTKLYRIDNFMDTGETEYCMWMRDWSTPREFIEFVEPEVGKSKDADLCQAHAFGVDLKEYLGCEARG